jgi:uroporphyrin-3 C-methyltransferase
MNERPMNESTPESAKPAAQSAPAAQPQEAPARGEPDTSVPAWRMPVMLVIVAALLVVCAQWYDTRSQIAAIREEVAQRLRASDSAAGESSLLAKQAQEAVREAQAKLTVIENKIAESQSQQLALEALYQELSRSRDEWALAEIEQILTVASQQLQLAGNVQAALLALQTAEGRLARPDRPQFIPLRRVLNRDIERLKGAPNMDIPGMALRLDNLIANVDKLPLQFDERMQSAPMAAASTGAGRIWERVLTEVWDEMKQLVRIRNMDQPDVALLPPTQAFFLRENLQLRLLSARQALLMRDPAHFRTDLETARAWMARYYDTRAKTTAAALESLKQLAAGSINVELPAITDSLTAVRNFKVSREKVLR